MFPRQGAGNAHTWECQESLLWPEESAPGAHPQVGYNPLSVNFRGALFGSCLGFPHLTLVLSLCSFGQICHPCVTNSHPRVCVCVFPSCHEGTLQDPSHLAGPVFLVQDRNSC
jgi:hypothetical protein